MMKKLLSLLLVTLLYFSCKAQFGQLDSSFGTNGFTYIDRPTTLPTSYMSITDIAVQSTGKIIVAGFESYAMPGNFAYRLNTDGTIDTTFTVINNTDLVSQMNTNIYIQPDDKIVFNGHSDSAISAVLLRYNENGQIDTTFGNDGTVPFDITIYSIEEMLPLSNGKILVMDGIPSLHRLNSDGSPDTTFGTYGSVHLFPLPAFKMVADANGNIYVFAYTYGSYEISIIKIDSTGHLDNSFGTNGIQVNSISYSCNIYEFFLKNDGKFVASGTFNGIVPQTICFQFDSTGLLDPTFGTGGVVIIPNCNLSTTEQCFSMAVQGDNKIVLGSHAISPSLTPPAMQSDFAAIRLNTDGTMDPTFGPVCAGISIAGDVEVHDIVQATEIQPDGNILLAGATENTPQPFPSTFLSIARFISGYNPSTLIHDPISENAFEIYPNPVVNSIKIKAESVEDKFESYSIMNLTSQVINSGKLKNKNLEINTSTLLPGLYILKLTTKNGSAFSRKFIKH